MMERRKNPISDAVWELLNGSSGLRCLYDFEQMHPEYGLNRYSSILEANGIEWEMDSMSAKDVSVLDGKCIMAMLMGAVRAERFCDGALLGFFKKGCIKKWLERLKEIDELESVCVRRESDYLFVIRDYLVEHGMKYDENIDNKVTARKNGKTYGFSEHLQAMVYSLLSAQRPWAEIVKHLDEIDGIFFGYDAKKILEQTDTYFVDRIREIKCGNRNIHDQMKYLPDNIATLRSIEKEYGNLDAFVISAPAHEIVKVLTDYKSKYKLRNMGEALCWEYLRNVGIDGAKPDVHLRRFLGSERMGKDNHMIATVSEVIDTVRRLSKESRLSMVLSRLEATVLTLGSHYIFTIIIMLGSSHHKILYICFDHKCIDYRLGHATVIINI